MSEFHGQKNARAHVKKMRMAPVALLEARQTFISKKKIDDISTFEGREIRLGRFVFVYWSGISATP